MANRGKTEFLAAFKASLATSGYRQVQTGIFRKPGDGFEYQTQLSFSGRVAVTANVDCGFWIESVERWGDECPPILQQRRSGSKNLATVFASISLVSNWAGTKIDREIDLDRDWDDQIASVTVAIEAIENKFRSLADVAGFAVNEVNIPLGHHAYRVPVLLQQMQRQAEFDRYVERVEGTNFIPNYSDYIATLR